MNDRVFVDSNILIYAHDADAGTRHEKAADLLRQLWQKRNGILSTQVLQEFYVNVTRKIPKPLPKAAAREIIRNYTLWIVETIDGADVVRASEIEEQDRVNFWDALIMVAAAKAGASRILSEDLQAGQSIAGVLVENPFS